MNDPHVVALIYDIEHDSTIDYSQALPLTKELDAFTVKIDNGQVRLEPKEDYASAADARASADDLIRNWELDVALRIQPGRFNLVFNRPEIIDRSPTPGIAQISVHGRSGKPYARVSVKSMPRTYPEPPCHVTLGHDDDVVVLLLNRYRNYRDGKEPLASMAYFCSTMLNEYLSTGERRGDKLKISGKVQRAINRLSSRQGGQMGARKWDAITIELDACELSFLEQAVRLIIRRVAEVARDETRQLRTITLADLPKIPLRDY